MATIRRNKAVEDPERLIRFAQEVAGLDWVEAAPTALETLFNALSTLVHHEVEFYYRARKRQRRFSAITRGGALVLSTLGILAPLLASAGGTAVPREIGAYGYPLLALAGSMLVVNRLFGATGGHVRYVTAQLELERILTATRLDWAAWNARSAMSAWDEARVGEGFAILRDLSERAYKVIQSETVAWGKDVSDALSEYSRSVSAQPSSSGATAGGGD